MFIILENKKNVYTEKLNKAEVNNNNSNNNLTHL